MLRSRPLSLHQCVMEIFVFARMDGLREDIVVRLLDGASNFRLHLSRFDAGQARCFLDRDRQKMLAVIEATFGTMAPFNSYVRQMFSVTIDRSCAKLSVAEAGKSAPLPSSLGASDTPTATSPSASPPAAKAEVVDLVVENIGQS